jgi:hypothetical protein
MDDDGRTFRSQNSTAASHPSVGIPLLRVLRGRDRCQLGAPKSGGSTKPGLPGRGVRIPHTCILCAGHRRPRGRSR